MITKKIDENILTILSRVTVQDNIIFLTCGQLDRKQYRDVNSVLEVMGGKWNRKQKGYVFNEDPTDRLEQVLLSGEIIPPKKYGYFPTPMELARHVVSLADIQPGHQVLEPSAGQGAIADQIPQCAIIYCVELLQDNYEILRAKGYRILTGDFLSLQEGYSFYDRVVMNPPFERQADIDHVLHAYKFLKPGGRLVSIMSSGVAFRENRKTIEFRKFLDSHGRMERNPEGTFKESGTNVSSVTVIIEKD